MYPAQSMARYRTTGGLDDVSVMDGDEGFVGMDSRRPNWQLEKGLVSFSGNGRIDGDWVPRRGVDVVTSELISNGSPLRLPFWLIDTAGGLAITAAERVTETVTLTIPAHGLAYETVGASLTLEGNVLFTAVDISLAGNDITIEYDTPSSDIDVVVGVVGPAITITPGSPRVIVTGTLTSDGSDPVVFGDLIYAGEVNGAHNYTDTGTPTDDVSADFSYYCKYTTQLFVGSYWLLARIPSLGGGSWKGPTGGGEASPDLVATWTPVGTSTGTPTVTAGPSNAAEVIAAVTASVAASALVTASDVGDETLPVGVIAATNLAGAMAVEKYAYLRVSGITGVTVDPNGVRSVTVIDDDTMEFTIAGATGSETYSIAGSDDKIASFIDDTSTEDVLGSCIFSDPDNSNDEFAIIAFGVLAKKVSLATGAVTSLTYPGSETINSAVSMIQAFDRVILFRAGDKAMEWIPGAAGFVEVASGAYTQPQVLTTTHIGAADGLITFTVVDNTTIAAGDMLRIYSSTDALFADAVGNEYEVKSASSTSITTYIPIPDITYGVNATTQIGRNISVGGGFGHMPFPAWGQYFQRRLWVPYAYDPVTLAARGVTDEIAVSDIMDSDTYDLIANQFRITGGIADHLVGMHPFYNDTMIVFNRNSIHSINGASGSLADASVNELTREVGCMARKSIITQGANVFFLSDNGVYGVGFVDQYNLRGIERPLSQPIQPYIDRINVDLAGNAIGIYFNNRYWLAVPLDSTPKLGDARGNNAILVFNVLNGAWESVDTYNDPSFLISNLLIGRAGARNDLYAVTDTGGVHIMEANDADHDNIASVTSTSYSESPITAVLTTRGYLAGTLERKRFTEIGITAKGGTAQSDFSIGMATDDPDSIGSTVTIQDSFGDTLAAQDTADVRVRAGGVRGQNGSVTITRRIGRPSLRSVSLTGTVTNRATISQK